MPQPSGCAGTATSGVLECPLPERIPLHGRCPLASGRITVVGGGLAGCEAAWQAARRGVQVDLYEMRPVRNTPAHQTSDLAELVCSNSLKSNLLDTASGLLKEEMRRCDSLVVRVADGAKVPAGGALRRPPAVRPRHNASDRQRAEHSAAARGDEDDSGHGDVHPRHRSACLR